MTESKGRNNMAQMKFPRVLVTIEQADGTVAEVAVQTDNRDAVRFDLMRARKGWPAMGEAPLLFMTVLAFLAIRRSDATMLPDDAETAIDMIVDVTPVDADGNPVDDTDEAGLAVVDPTRTGL